LNARIARPKRRTWTKSRLSERVQKVVAPGGESLLGRGEKEESYRERVWGRFAGWKVFACGRKNGKKGISISAGWRGASDCG